MLDRKLLLAVLTGALLAIGAPAAGFDVQQPEPAQQAAPAVISNERFEKVERNIEEAQRSAANAAANAISARQVADKFETIAREANGRAAASDRDRAAAAQQASEAIAKAKVAEALNRQADLRVRELLGAQKAAEVQASKDGQILQRNILFGLVASGIVTLAFIYWYRHRTPLRPSTCDYVLSNAEGNIFVSGETLANRPDGVVIGRNPKYSEVVINDNQISRRHVRLTLEDDELWIEDLDSLGGSFLDGAALTPGVRTKIQPGARLRLAELEYDFVERPSV